MLRLALAVLPLVACAAVQRENTAYDALASIRAADVQAHVDYLASDALEGRPADGEGALVAADYLAAHFERFGLRPLGDDGTYFRSIEEEGIAPNVVAVLPGTGPDYFLITAHYDHLPPRESGEDRIYNGADDNASGTAAVLELAEAFALLKPQPRASVVFVCFTAEEMGLRGSRHFTEHPPFPLERILGVINLDMISRGRENLIFCEDGGTADWLKSLAEGCNDAVGVEIRFDKHPEWIPASDHYPFMQAGVPTLYFGVEDHEDYHRVTDHADRILPELAKRVARLTFLITTHVVSG